jgi:hypothetical protein
MVLLAAGSVVGLAFVLAIVVLLARQGHQTPVAHKGPPCPSIASWQAAVLAAERRADWQVAAADAQLGLLTPHLCAPSRRALTASLVADRLQVMEDTYVPPYDQTAQGQEGDGYHTLRHLARRFGVPMPSPLQVADSAYRSGHMALARAAWEDALAAGEVTIDDVSAVRFYDSTLYNIAFWWVKPGNPPAVRQSGLRLLVTAARIDACFRLGSGQPAQLLTQLVGPESYWPQPSSSPVLTHCTGRG